MLWFRAKCPIAADEQRWVDDNMSWFADSFGTSWLHSPVVLPTDDFFPAAYAGTEADIRHAVTTICEHMRIEPRRVHVTFDVEDGCRHSTGTRSTTTTGTASMTPTSVVPETYHQSRVVGRHRRVAGKVLLSLDKSLGQTPLLLVAVIARELAHERLVGLERRNLGRTALDPLVDLLTVYLGFGIFMANAALEFSHVSEADYPRASQWSASRLGHLTEPIYGYALARYAQMRGETRPRWMRFVDSNPRSYLKRGLRYLK